MLWEQIKGGCSSVWGSQSMLMLHVWVDLMDFPLGKVMVIGLCDSCLLVMGTFSTRKCPVPPESDMVCLTDLVILAVLKIASACDNSCRLLACIICCHALFLVGLVGFVGRLLLLVGGMYSSLWDESSSLANSSIVAVISSAKLSLILLMHTFLSSAKPIPLYVACQYSLLGVGYSWK